MDQYDLKILKCLQNDGRMSTAELGRIIGLSTTATKERVKKLEEEGVIKGYSAIISHNALDYDLTAFITVPIGEIPIVEMGERLAAFDEVTECHKVTGNACYLVKVIVKDAAHLERLVDAINIFARTTYTYIALSTIKSYGKVPIDDEG